MSALSTGILQRSRARRPGPATGAALLFSAAWVAGLLIAPAGAPLGASGRVVASFWAVHAASASLQALFVHGIAGVALIALSVRLRSGHGQRSARRATAARAAALVGLAAGVLSLLQAALELVLGLSAPAMAAATAGDLQAAINRFDGIKMFALAGLVAGIVFALRDGQDERLRTWTGIALTVLLVPAALGYLLLTPAPATIAAPALIVLLVWLPMAAMALDRRSCPGLV